MDRRKGTKMKLSSINLNLLVALDALLDEQNVSRAAKRLNLSQSQLSNILKDLRDIFDDALLVRGPERQMFLTEKANSLIIPVSNAMNSFEDIFIEKKKFNPAKAKITFKIGMNNYTSSLILPQLLTLLEQKAPNISINVTNLASLNDYSTFTTQNMDLAIGAFNLSSSNIISEHLFTTSFTCIASKNHKAFEKKSLDLYDFIRYPLILITFSRENWSNLLKLFHDKVGKDVNISARVPHILPILNMLNKTDHICISNKSLATKFYKQFDLSLRDIPFEVPDLNYKMYWKRVDNNKQSLIWLRNTITNIIANINDSQMLHEKMPD